MHIWYVHRTFIYLIVQALVALFMVAAEQGLDSVSHKSRNICTTQLLCLYNTWSTNVSGSPALKTPEMSTSWKLQTRAAMNIHQVRAFSTYSIAFLFSFTYTIHCSSPWPLGDFSWKEQDIFKIRTENQDNKLFM